MKSSSRRLSVPFTLPPLRLLPSRTGRAAGISELRSVLICSGTYWSGELASRPDDRDHHGHQRHGGGSPQHHALHLLRLVDSLAELDAGTDNGDQQPDGGGNDRPTTNATKNVHTAPPALPPPTGGPQRLLAVGSTRLRSPSAQLAKELLGQMAYSLVVVRRAALAGHPGATAQPGLEAGSALLPSRRAAPS